MLGIGAVSVERAHVPIAEEDSIPPTGPGGETVMSKLDQDGLTSTAQASADEPSLKGLGGDIPWERATEPANATPKPVTRALAQTATATNALPWDAIEPVPFQQPVTNDTVKRKTSEPESKTAAQVPAAQLPKIDVPASGDVGRWVKAKAKALKGENRGRPIYHFEFWLDAPAEIKKRLVAVAYDFNTPAMMPRSQTSNEEKTGFRISVGGLACSDNVTVTLQFDDGSTQQAEVDGCRLVS
ncbi:MAG: hypothetical protein FJX44_08790 [Alphaproteobacteria bacterium]|nr:hypothetical protein [Alphaproteobacteria bacterium]